MLQRASRCEGKAILERCRACPTSVSWRALSLDWLRTNVGFYLHLWRAHRRAAPTGDFWYEAEVARKKDRGPPSGGQTRL